MSLEIKSYLLILNPLGHFGFTPLTRFVLLPLTQVIVFLATTGEPAITIFAVAETGAKVAVPP
jgi:hypothetical protein